MPCPHFDLKIIQRSKRQSAVASAAYQSGERLFSEYDQKQKYYTEFLPVDPDKADQDLRDVLAHGLMDEADKKQISTLLQSGRSNSEIAYWLSRAYSGEIETLNLETGDIADYRTTAQGIELEVMDAEEKRLAMLYFRWDEVAPLLRGMYVCQVPLYG